MALKLLTGLPSGIQADYWRIQALVYDYDRNVTAASVHLYVNKAARDSGAESLASKRVEFSGELNRASAYGSLKAGAFAGAEDC